MEVQSGRDRLGDRFLRGSFGVRQRVRDYIGVFLYFLESRSEGRTLFFFRFFIVNGSFSFKVNLFYLEIYFLWNVSGRSIGLLSIMFMKNIIRKIGCGRSRASGLGRYLGGGWGVCWKEGFCRLQRFMFFRVRWCVQGQDAVRVSCGRFTRLCFFFVQKSVQVMGRDVWRWFRVRAGVNKQRIVLYRFLECRQEVFFFLKKG